ncbi:hypothetical protein K503DRAFT_767638 [Rhizopogon vinicolor AM-OR11-026]|uniref:F-box domain-containing protein n=1 Tax=Rhizopogon vinicolor AM-OR11-026 TaxID=1314800 RepID=A0A1B7N9H1_9AGAM|nr:hypothetical protein K503DRAFT_767638 [Rhizopogon vinicolor AM-OR11-026]
MDVDRSEIRVETTLSLPNELIALVFNELDVVSILKCKQVCRLFNSVIAGNAQLLYKIELFFARFEDGTHCNLDTAGRLRAFRQYQQAWNNLSFPHSRLISMQDSHPWELSGGVLCQAIQSGFTCVQIPCRIKGIPEREWTVDDLGFDIRDFTIDTSQDLIVAVEQVGVYPNHSCKIHLRTLSTGEHHPMSVAPFVTHVPLSMHEEFKFLIQTCASRIAVLFQQLADDSSSDELVIWDWKSGHQKLFIQDKDLQSFSFVTEDLVLIGIVGSDNTPPRLDVISIGNCSREMVPYRDVVYVCGLEYPKMKANIVDMSIRSEPTPGWAPSRSLEAPFFFARSDRIFTITLRVSPDTSTNEECTVLVVPLSTIMAQVDLSHDTPKRRVPWKQWGPYGSHMLFRNPSEIWVCYVYGSKFIQLLPWEKKKQARVYDFNKYSARRDVRNGQTSEPKLPWKRLGRPYPLNSQCSAFDEEVNTYLPGRVAFVDVMLNDAVQDWEAAMIGEDNIVMVSPRAQKYGYMAM